MGLLPGGLLSDGARWCIGEIILVDDCGPDSSDRVIRELEQTSENVRAVWLMRNFGQHAATIAGLASTRSEWVVTMDEDGQHDPNDISRMLECARKSRSQLIYGKVERVVSHSRLRNASSRFLKDQVLPLLIGRDRSFFFSSYRLMTGEVARTVAAYANRGVYLDIALSWLVQRSETCSVRSGAELRSESGYRLGSLISHFLRLVVSAGVRPLRIALFAGVAVSLTGLVLVVYLIFQRVTGNVSIVGWTSLMATTLLLGGVILLVLGVIAEYVGFVVRRALGAPLYVVSDQRRGR
jgi:glycosyltransferase involved in cell wall biosynthesis